MMPTPRRAHRLSFWLIGLAALGFDPSGDLLPRVSVACRAQDQPTEGDAPGPDLDGEMPDQGQARRPRAGRAKSARKGARRPSRNPARKAAAGPIATPATPDSSGPKFSRDVAPILVGNCVGCHTGDGAGLRRSKLDLSSFEKLLAGTPEHKVIVPGKPLESHLYLRVHGDETPRMPQGGDRTLSEASVAQIERWIKAGASLDAGLDAKAAFRTYAATPEELRKLELGKLSVQERDKKTEDAGRSRFAQANPRLKPDVTPGEHFLLFGNLPKDRSSQAIKGLEAQYGYLRRILGGPATDWSEKVGIYVFNDRKDLIEFIRTVEGREVDLEVQSSSRMAVAQPYIAVLDPARGREEPSPTPTPRRRAGRSRKGDEGGAAEARTLAGLLAEALGTGAVDAAGKAPGWLSAGVGAYLAGRVEPRGAEIQKLRAIAAEACRDGWNVKAGEILGDHPDLRPEEVRAIGYAMVDWLLSPELGRAFPAFVAGMLKDPADLPGVLKSVYNSGREQFLANSGEWVAERFGTLP